MSPRYIVFVGTSVAPSQQRPSHAWNAANEFGSIVTTKSPLVIPRFRYALAQRRLMSWSSRRVSALPSTSCMAIASGSSRASFASMCGSTNSRSSIVSPSSRAPSESWFTGVYVSAVVDYPGLVDDLVAEEADLDTVVASIDDRQWAIPTPASGWDVRDSIAHLAYSEELAATAMADGVAFARRLEAMLADLVATEATMLAEGRAKAPAAVLAWWRRDRARVADGLRERDARDRIPWITGPMSAVSFATARLMETLAHELDLRAAHGSPVVATPRLRHVADLGVRTRGFSYAINGRAAPAGDVRVELDGPDGERWTWGTSESDA